MPKRYAWVVAFVNSNDNHVGSKHYNRSTYTQEPVRMTTKPCQNNVTHAKNVVNLPLRIDHICGARGSAIWTSRVRMPLAPIGNFGNIFYPTLSVSFGRNGKHRWSLLSDIYVIRRNISRTGGKCVICRGLHVLPCQNDHDLSNSIAML